MSQYAPDTASASQPDALNERSVICPWCGAELTPARDPRLTLCSFCKKMSNYEDLRTNPCLYDDLSEDEKRALGAWIDEYLMPAPTAKLGTTYWLKHQYQRMSGRYVFSGALNGALLAHGFEPFSTDCANWMFGMQWRKDPFVSAGAAYCRR